MKNLKKSVFVLLLFLQVSSPVFADYYITEEQMTQLTTELNGLKTDNETLKMDLMTQQILAENLQKELQKCKTEQKAAETELKKLKDLLTKSSNKKFGEKMIYSTAGFIIGIFSTVIIELTVVKSYDKNR